MSDFQTRIEDLVGTVGDTALITDSLKDVGSEILSILPDIDLNLFTQTGNITTSGLAIDGKKIFGVDKADYVARQIDARNKARYKSATSIYAATDTSPVFYIENEKVYVIGSSGALVTGTLHYVDETPNVAYNTASGGITGFPETAERLLVVGAAVKCRVRQLADKRSDLPVDLDLSVVPSAPTLDLTIASALSDISYTSPTAPTTPNAPVITSGDASATGISSQPISIGTAPSYTKAIMNLESAPTISDLDLSVNGKNVVISATLPSLPVFVTQLISASPSYMKENFHTSDDRAFLTQSGDNFRVRSAQSVSFNETAPSYTQPVFDAPTLGSIADFFISAVAPSAPALSDNSVSFSESAPTYNVPVLSLEDVPVISDLSIVAVPPELPSLSSGSISFSTSAPTYNPALTTPDFDDADTWINTEEDSEMSAARVQVISAQLQEYQANIQNSLNSFNEENAEYQIEFQKAVQNAQLSSTDDNQKIQKYQAELNRYQNDINKEVQEYTNSFNKDLQLWQINRSTSIQKYQSDIQNNLNRFNEENAQYQIEFQKSTQNAQLSSKDDDQKVQKYQAELQAYSHNLTKEVQEYQQILQRELQEWQTEYSSRLQKYNGDIQGALNVFNKENVEYQAKLQIAIQDSQHAQQAAIQNASLETDVNKQNKIMEAKRLLDDYSSQLQRYSVDVQRYQAEVSTEIQLYTVNEIQKEMALWQTEQSQNLDKYAKDIQDNLNSFNADNTSYQAELQKSIAQAQLDVQRLTAVAQQADTVALRNKANDLQASIQDYQLTLSKYSADVQEYGAEQADAVNVMQAAIQKRASELQELGQLNQDKLAKYAQEIQSYSSETQAEIQDYTTKVQRYNQEHQLMLAELQVLQQQYQQGLQLLAGIPNKEK